MKLKIAMLSIALASSTGIAGHNPDTDASTDRSITQAEVIDAQKTWGEAIVAMGDAYTAKDDYHSLAADVVSTLYAYNQGPVLFKPTKAAQEQFRSTEEEAISYFVTGAIAEDHGFAIQPWSNVRFENSGIIVDNDSAVAMGNYYFTDLNTGKETKVEFTFGYQKADDGELLINLHHSSFPFFPKH